MGRTSDAKERLIAAILELIWEQSYGSVTIDMICDKAKVKKGSFYYFFESKMDLVAQALEALWEEVRADMDSVFSPSKPPVQRLLDHMEATYHKTLNIREKHGRVLGCPYFNLGTEICGVESELICKIQEILADYKKYFESAIRDAVIEKTVGAHVEPADTTRFLFSLYEGTLTQARIQDNPELVKDLYPATLRILGLEKAPV